MKQYFQENVELAKDVTKITICEFGFEFTFYTHRGLFSYKEVDANSLVLIRNIPKIKGRLLDLGCGFGAIGIMLAKVNPVSLTGSDINGLAIEMAKKNAAANHVPAEYLHSDCFERISGFFDTIALNPPIHAGKDVVYKMFVQAKQHLTPTGVFYVVMQKKHGAESAIAYLKQVYPFCETVYKKKGVNVIMATSIHH